MTDAARGRPGGSVADAIAADGRGRDARLLRRVRLRLALWSGGATLLVLVSLGVATWFTLRDQLAVSATAEAQARADAVAAYVEEGGPFSTAPLRITMTGRGSSTFAFLYGPGPGGLQFLQPADFEPPAGPDRGSLERAWEDGRDVTELTIGTAPWRILSQRRALGDQPYAVQVFQDRAAEQRALDTLLLVLIGGGALAVVGALAVGALYADRALVPIRRSLADRRAALQRQREFAADASHELRTPLTVVRSSVDHLRRHADQPVGTVGSALDDIEAEVAHLGALVDDLLLLARADSGAMDLALQPLELGDLVTEAASTLAGPAADRGVDLRVDPEPVMVEGDQVRLRQLVTILVDNAVRHSPRTAVVEVAVRRDGDRARLTVLDAGPGIPPADLPRVFDRFWQGSGGTAGGAGLGLSIAAAIVTRHAGRIGVANRDGGGAAFTVELPLAGAGTLAGA